ncbi:alpha-L-arabinofuranosidase C-terminal domain-containing protein [Pseudarcicella hirudinis]|uniref:alpha-L-arabinofuranosidase C-terminal domain-containing protein n=1 Tax=Pseudarcicella hirudinis TaxID=1079859 RepID=UPI0035EB4ECD
MTEMVLRFAGEYAAQSDKTVSVDNKNNWKCAIAEAAFMTGLERNAQVVNMASYAPLFAHVDGWQWTPDMIWVDNLRIYGTPNYYVQKLYSLNKGTHVLSMTQNNQALTGQDGLFASASLDKNTNEVILKFVNTSKQDISREINLEGVKKTEKTGKVWTMQSNDPEVVNSLNNPVQLSPKESAIALSGKNKFALTVAPGSFTVLRIKTL